MVWVAKRVTCHIFVSELKQECHAALVVNVPKHSLEKRAEGSALSYKRACAGLSIVDIAWPGAFFPD